MKNICLPKNSKTGEIGVSENKFVLALYDFASKQEFIYRTSKVKEISGASKLLSDMYAKFCDILKENGKLLKFDLDSEFSWSCFESDKNIIGEVLYEGGGNLMVLYKSKEDYVEANKIISVMLLKEFPTLKMISCFVEAEGNFRVDRTALYRKLIKRKNCFPTMSVSAVTPFTQVDPTTFLPVVMKDMAKELSYSADRVAKLKAYKYSSTNNLDNLEEMIAVVYVDGNAMGEKLKSCDSDDYNDGVKKLRIFSKTVNRIYVEEPMKAIEKTVGLSKHNGFRRVIGGGDEITIICDARIALAVVNSYFDALSKQTMVIDGDEFKCTACAGVAVAHAKTPFSSVYEIAEAACESAKEEAHINDGNYFDFHYCHAGITGTFETIRAFEQKGITNRPYKFVADRGFVEFSEYDDLLRRASRSNVKTLGAAAQRGIENYQFECKRVNAYLSGEGKLFKAHNEEMKIVYDMSEFFDLWFSKEVGTE